MPIRYKYVYLYYCPSVSTQTQPQLTTQLLRRKLPATPLGNITETTTTFVRLVCSPRIPRSRRIAIKPPNNNKNTPTQQRHQTTTQKQRGRGHVIINVKSSPIKKTQSIVHNHPKLYSSAQQRYSLEQFNPPNNKTRSLWSSSARARLSFV